MKSNAITRIVLFSIAIVILIGILVAGILIKFHLIPVSTKNENVNNNIVNDIADNLVEHISDNFTSQEPITDGTTSSTGSVAASEIREIEIQWISGNVTIQPGDTDTITFTETDGLSDENQMVWKQSRDKLIIQFSKVKFSFGLTVDYSKNLVVTVPRDWVCNDLQIDSVSANVSVSDLNVKEMELESVSGEIFITNCTVTDLSAETASGNLEFQGALTELSFDSISAGCTAVFTNTPKQIELETVSGNLTLALPETTGFTASIDSLSGGITTDFATTVSKNRHTYGDGSCKIEVETVSGDITIRKA